MKRTKKERNKKGKRNLSTDEEIFAYIPLLDFEITVENLGEVRQRSSRSGH
jgi:hypothetical protein